MGLETATYISDLVTTNPISGDTKGQGDNHLRLIKEVLKNTFPNADKPFILPEAAIQETASRTISADEINKFIPINASGGDVAMTLPVLAPGSDLWAITFARIDNVVANDVTIVGTINGVANYLMPVQWAVVTFVWDGSLWYAFRSQTEEIPEIPDPIIPPAIPPKGRLTLTSNTPILAANVLSATTVYFTPYEGNTIPLYNGTEFESKVFAQLSLALHSSHSIAGIFDVFVTEEPDDVIKIVTGPAWQTPGAGAGARGVGSGSTELTRLLGFWVNAVELSAARNGGTTYIIPANRATYVGSIFIDGTAGQVTCHVGFGQSRKWGVWNAYNRKPIILKMGDATATWTYNSNVFRQSNAAAGNTLAVFTGLPEETFDLSFVQNIAFESSQFGKPRVAIGVNSTTVASGRIGVAESRQLSGGTATHGYANLVSQHIAAPALGIQNINSLERDDENLTTTFHGAEEGMLLTAKYLG